MSNLKMSEPAVVFYIFDDLNRIIEIVTLKQSIFCGLLQQSDRESDKERLSKKFTAVFQVDGYFLSEFMDVLKVSAVYYRMVFNNFLNSYKHTDRNSEIKVKFQLVKPKLEVIDHAWNYKLCNLLAERQELEHAMSWLSTLGGAFSALGDCFENCAKIAGKISIQQFKIAFRLGEPPLVARCKLYMALSLIQLDKLVAAKNLIQEQYEIAKHLNDFRLQNMCHGVWAKLQYVYKQKKNKKGTLIINFK